MGLIFYFQTNLLLKYQVHQVVALSMFFVLSFFVPCYLSWHILLILNTLLYFGYFREQILRISGSLFLIFHRCCFGVFFRICSAFLVAFQEFIHLRFHFVIFHRQNYGLIHNLNHDLTHALIHFLQCHWPSHLHYCWLLHQFIDLLLISVLLFALIFVAGCQFIFLVLKGKKTIWNGISHKPFQLRSSLLSLQHTLCNLGHDQSAPMTLKIFYYLFVCFSKRR